MKRTLAIYLRSSVEQSASKRSRQNPDESDTIANQRKLLCECARRKGLGDHEIREYIDDGHSGTNFRRPAFATLIEDAKEGKIQAVIVKDFSRLGRDYIGVGDYAEQFFPKLGIRLISVNDEWDSAEHPGQTLELDTSFRTILYEMYSRDLSRKLKSAIAVRNQKGIYSTTLAPYGYQKDPEDKHHLIIDSEEAEIVRRIYHEAAKGTKITRIARMLTAEGVSTPSARNQNSGQTSRDGITAWSPPTIRTILQNEVYLGTILLNKMEHVYGRKMCRTRDESEWLRFTDRHEAIVTQEEFDEAQRAIMTYTRRHEPRKQKGIPLYCGHCGRKISGCSRAEGIQRCLNAVTDPGGACGNMLIVKTELLKLLKASIESQIGMFSEWSHLQTREMDQIDKLEKQIRTLRREREKLKKQRVSLYESYRDGHTSKEDFIRQKQELLDTEQKLMAEEEAFIAEEKQYEERQQEKADKAQEMQDIAGQRCSIEELVNMLIDRIEVFNDGTLSIRWKFQDEYPEYDEGLAGNIKADHVDKDIRALVYSSDMRLISEDNHGSRSRGNALSFCADALGYRGDEIECFYDKREEGNVFFLKDYMRMMAAASTGEHECIVINSFADLYLTREDFYNLLYLVIPALPCRFISILDQYDSKEEDEKALKDKTNEVFSKYNGQKRSDLFKYRSRERKAGTRMPTKMKHPKCSRLYGYYSDKTGCYSDREILKLIKSVYWDILNGTSHIEIFRKLNQDNVPTPNQFFREHGMEGKQEKNNKWNGEKLSAVLKNPRYAEECRYRDICDAKGKHCERHPIITKIDHAKANSLFCYRNR